MSQTLLLEHALLPDGWHRGVLVGITGGLITSLTAQPTPQQLDGVARIAGATIPGLPNLHSHTFQRGMAGLAETRGPSGDSFWTWRQVMYRFLEHLDPDDVEAIAAMAMMEMLEGGFTSLAEFHYLHHDPQGRAYGNRAELAVRIVAAAQQTGINLTLLPVLYAQGGFGGQPVADQQRRFYNDLDSYLSLHAASAEALRDLQHATIGIAPHSLRAVTPDMLAALLEAGLPGPVHLHIAEQVKEVDDCLAWSGQRPVEWLFNHHGVDANWCLIHATHMSESETQALARSNAVAGLCPVTEANLGDGFFNAPSYQALSGAWGVGSDSNVAISAFAELRCLEYGQRLLHRGRNLMAGAEGHSTGFDLYAKALRGGAQALQQPVGALRIGAQADWVTLDLTHPTLAPLPQSHWLDALVFVADRSAIHSVTVNGQTCVQYGHHHARDSITAHFTDRLKRLLARVG
jgi:formimidoylglutamate deiminase